MLACMPLALLTVPRRNDPCWCGSGRKFKACHQSSTGTLRPGNVSPTREVPGDIVRPPYIASGGVPTRGNDPLVKTDDVIQRMRRSGALAAEILAALGPEVAPGVTTEHLDQVCHQLTIDAGAYPSPLGYRSYPKSLCTSVNEVICHGIPDDRPLAEGDIVILDVTVFREGVHGDTSATFLVGQVDEASQKLVRVTRECLDRGIAAVRPGRPISDIGHAIETHAVANDLGVVQAFVGHGIGEEFHNDLAVPHYYTPAAATVMTPGMTFTIEPMITMGRPNERIWSDDWTAVTVDGLRSAQFEHTVLVTDDAVEVLTAPPSAR